MPISVEEIKSLLPKVKVFSLDSSATHIFLYDKRAMSYSAAKSLMDFLQTKGIMGALVGYDGSSGNPLTIYEVK